MWCSKSAAQSEQGGRSDCLSVLDGSEPWAQDWIRSGTPLFNSRHICYAVVGVWRPWTNCVTSLQATLTFGPPKHCVVHGEATLSLSAYRGWTTSADAVLPTSVHRESAWLLQWEHNWGDDRKNLVNSVCSPETETFLKTPLAPRGTLISRGGCWIRSKITKPFQLSAFYLKE